MLAEETSVILEKGQEAEILLFDLPKAAIPRKVSN